MQRLIKSLTAGRRLPFGLDTPALVVAEDVLQPGDWPALYTDGITEARDAAGAGVGEQRPVQLLTREVAGDRPPPKTVRG